MLLCKLLHSQLRDEAKILLLQMHSTYLCSKFAVNYCWCPKRCYFSWWHCHLLNCWMKTLMILLLGISETYIKWSNIIVKGLSEFNKASFLLVFLNPKWHYIVLNGSRRQYVERKKNAMYLLHWDHLIPSTPQHGHRQIKSKSRLLQLENSQTWKISLQM